MAENTEAPWRLDAPVEAIEESLGDFYVWFENEAVAMESAKRELVASAA